MVKSPLLVEQEKAVQMTLFHGLSAFPLTPIDDAGNVQPALLGAFLDRILLAGADSIGLLGSTGGYAYLSTEQRLEAVQVAVGCVSGRVPVIVGVGALRTDMAVALARDAKRAGADGLLLAPMSYTPLTDDEVFQHFVAVADAGDLPLCIYNNPGTTHFTFTESLIARLAKVTNITAVKMPLAANGDYTGEIARLRALTPDGFAVGYSGDWGAAAALLAGGDAWYSVIAGLLPTPAIALLRAAQRKDAKKVAEVDLAFQPLWEMFKTFGSFRVMHMIPDVLGLGTVEPPRPIQPLATRERPRLEAALDSLRSIRP